MNIDISEYKPVSKNTKCKQCSSINVTWHQNPGNRWSLCEIFTLDDELVYSANDIHMRYCIVPLRPWNRKEELSSPIERRAARQSELIAAAEEFMGIMGDDPEPKPETPYGDFNEPGTGEGHVRAMEFRFVDISDRIDYLLTKGLESNTENNELQTLYYRLYNEIPG